MVELHRAAREVTDHLRRDGQSAVLLRHFQRLDTVGECLLCLALPGCDGLDPLVRAVFVGHRGVRAETGCKTRRVAAIADLEVGLNGVRQLQVHDLSSSLSVGWGPRR
ncbi:hypothetical protein D9M70_589660 [compost metagenome]